jgi:hypothetical protein
MVLQIISLSEKAASRRGAHLSPARSSPGPQRLSLKQPVKMKREGKMILHP